MRASAIVVGTTVLLSCITSVQAGVIEYTDKNAWFDAANDVTTIGFAGHPDGSPVLPDDYAKQGLILTGQQLGYYHGGPIAFPNDGEGIRANNNTLFAHFDEPQYAIAVDYPGSVMIRLYSGEQVVHTAEFWPQGLVGFAGLVSDVPFDRVELFRHSTSLFVYIDDLHFGAIPAPGGLALLGLAALGARRRRV